jgi:hypothetical protein
MKTLSAYTTTGHPWLYRRIEFGWAPGVATSSDPVAARGLQIRDTAEYNSALLRLQLRRAVLAWFCQ